MVLVNIIGSADKTINHYDDIQQVEIIRNYVNLSNIIDDFLFKSVLNRSKKECFRPPMPPFGTPPSRFHISPTNSFPSKRHVNILTP